MEPSENVRKNVDHQWSEYIVYIICKGIFKITNFDEIISTFDETVDPKYLKDLMDFKNKNKIMDYYNKFYNEWCALNIIPIGVFLLGKNQHKYPEINELHLKRSGVKFKADIIVKTDVHYIGFSVKSSIRDTLTNYSVYKMLSNKNVKHLKKIQKKIITDSGLKIINYKKNPKKYHNLFRNKHTLNEYHTALNEIILENSVSIIQQWYDNLFGELPYKLYTFNGDTLSCDIPELTEVTLKQIPNPAKKPKFAAKLFYLLCLKLSGYKWEVRWKGDIFVSPQILTFKLHL